MSIAAAPLPAWRGKHEGASFIVCGCGPSLRELDRRDSITIGVNDVGRLFDPDYLVVVNPRNQFKNDRFRYVERSNARALFTQLDLGAVSPPVVRFRLGRYGGVDPDGETLHYTQNSPYVAVCLAAHLGARRIGLIGVDFTDDHFFARTGRHPLAGRVREIDAQYGRLAAALRARGIELTNLSARSRLVSLPRSCTTSPPERNEPMKISVDKYAPGMVADLLNRLADSARQLGYTVVRQARRSGHDRKSLAIVWNGRNHSGAGPTLYCEHGWLPRSAYQVSPRGINADSHLAPFRWDGASLSGEQSAALDAHLAAIKAASFSGYYQYMQPGKSEVEVPSNFLLVPLQIDTDTNILRHAPASLRSMQALIDHISRVNPPWPVIFKQHPADVRRHNLQLKLRTRRKMDSIWAHSRGNIHQLLKSPACRGIVTINSNVAHDGLLWDVPAIVLGRNLWPASGAVKPFLTSMPADWSQLAASMTDAATIHCRRAYAHYLMTHQWTLADASDSARVAALIESAVAVKPRMEAAIPRMRPTPPRPAAVRLSIRQTVPSGRPSINVVAQNKGWLFEHWKQRMAAAPRADLKITASDRPLRNADAWIFIRAREAASTPDASRTLVQIHDHADPASYQRGGERAAVRECAALSLTHARQKELLRASGINVDARACLVQPVGWCGRPTAAPNVARALAAPRIAWLGRPVTSRDGGDAAQLQMFAEAVRALRPGPVVSLIGERLEKHAAQLRSAGVDCRAAGFREFPLARSGEWLRAFDCVVVTGQTDAGPWPLFDVLHAGVPVVATRVGWAPELLADGACGRLVDDVPAMSAALEEILAARESWRARGADLTRRVAGFSLDAWIAANLDLALGLARPALMRVA